MTTTIVLGVLLALAIAVLGAVGLKLAIAAGLRSKQDAALIKSMGDQLCAYNDTQVERIRAEQIGPYARAEAERVRRPNAPPQAFPADNGVSPDVLIADRAMP